MSWLASGSCTLQCNAGQDTLCLARRGARATGVDLSDGAIAFARGLSEASGISAELVDPYSNGCRVHRLLVPDPADARRWIWPSTAVH